MSQRRWILGGMILASMFMLPGCIATWTRVRDLRDELMIHHNNRRLARDAWNACRKVYRDLPWREDFEMGFKRGYTDRASGLNGCPPALPPRRYWTAKNMGMHGIERTNTWFDGYRHGVAVAEQDGVADLSRIPTSIPMGPPPPAVMDMAETITPTPASSPEEYLNPAAPQSEVAPPPAEVPPKSTAIEPAPASSEPPSPGRSGGGGEPQPPRTETPQIQPPDSEPGTSAL